MELNSKNYHSNQANWHYLSVSQFKHFQQCEAKAMARLMGQYEDSEKKSFQLGHYLHAWNEGCLDKYIRENKGVIFQKSGKKYADYIKADEAIETLKNDKYAMKALKGDKEVIMTGKIDGIEWKIRIDNLLVPIRFSDLKYLADVEPKYDRTKRTHVSVIEYWEYDKQAAVYQEIIKQNTGKKLEPLFVVVTKENPPNKAIFGGFQEFQMEQILESIRNNQSRVIALKQGIEEPIRCGTCDYCRATKKLDSVAIWNEI